MGGEQTAMLHSSCRQTHPQPAESRSRRGQSHGSHLFHGATRRSKGHSALCRLTEDRLAADRQRQVDSGGPRTTNFLMSPGNDGLTQKNTSERALVKRDVPSSRLNVAARLTVCSSSTHTPTHPIRSRIQLSIKQLHNILMALNEKKQTCT